MTTFQPTKSLKDPKLKMTRKEFQEVMAEADCEPEMFLARVMNGVETPDAHPFLYVLEQFAKDLNGEAPTVAQFAELLQEAREYLRYEPADIDLRVACAKELLPYLYPKRKAVDVQHQINIGTGVMVAPGMQDSDDAFQAIVKQQTKQMDEKEKALLEHGPLEDVIEVEATDDD